MLLPSAGFVLWVKVVGVAGRFAETLSMGLAGLDGPG